MQQRPLFVCGMLEEARLVPPGTIVVVGAGNAELLLARLAVLNPKAISSVTSFGTCGGLNPILKPGEVIVDSRFKILTSALMVTVEQKAGGFVAGFDSVDEETAHAQAFAEKNGLPFHVIRAIADPYDFSLPPAACLPLKPDGTPDSWAVTKSVFSDPSQIPALTRVAMYNSGALKSLKAYLRYQWD